VTRTTNGGRGDAARPKNRLLAGLPDAEFKRIKPLLRTVPVGLRYVFHRPNEPVTQVYFPNGGVGSITTALEDGSIVEVATVGDEGLVGIEAMFGEGALGRESIMQVPDTNAELMTATDFRRELARGEAFTNAVHRYAQAFLSLAMHSTACMALHPVLERCCRWLLMTHDRIHRDEFQLSHEFLATMLGSTRPTVSVVAGTLQKAGFIKYVHGRMTILDRAGLESASCECYRTVKADFDRLKL
jgi:CRP-like cAMP-binding protein